jgi:hypothetical protein
VVIGVLVIGVVVIGVLVIGVLVIGILVERWIFTRHSLGEGEVMVYWFQKFRPVRFLKA